MSVSTRQYSLLRNTRLHLSRAVTELDSSCLGSTRHSNNVKVWRMADHATLESMLLTSIFSVISTTGPLLHPRHRVIEPKDVRVWISRQKSVVVSKALP